MEMGESVDIETSLHNLKESIMCPICLEDWNDPVTLTCSHIFCKSCINEAIGNKMNCPFCSAPLTKKSMSDSSGTFVNIINAIRDLLDVCYPKNTTGQETNKSLDSLKLIRPVFDPGDIVHVAPRLWPGINKPGGTAWILSADNDHELYDVKYVLTGAIDRSVPCAYVRVANDVPEDRGRRSRQSKPPQDANSTSRKSRLHLGTSSATSSSSTRSKQNYCNSVGEDVHDKGKKRMRTEEKIPSSPSTSHFIPPIPMVLLPSTLDEEESKLLDTFCHSPLPPLDSMSGVTLEIVHKYSDSVTHVVVSADKLRRRMPTDKKRGKQKRGQDTNGSEVELVIKQRTMKYLRGLLTGKWIVSVEWIEESIKQGRVLSPEPFEIHRDHKTTLESSGAPRRARQLHDEGGRPTVFQKRRVLLFGAYPSPGPTKADLLELLLWGGAGDVLCDEMGMAEIVTMVNSSLDSGLRVDRAKHRADRGEGEVVIAVLSNEESLRELCDYLYARVSDLRSEQSYDFDDFKDHISGLIDVVHPNWVFDCISNFTFIHPLRCSHSMNILTKAGANK